MKRVKIFIILILGAGLLFSCGIFGSGNKEKHKVLENESSTDIKRNEYGYNIVDELYEDVVKNDKEIQKLDEEIDDLIKKRKETMKQYNDYNSKITSYHNYAKILANQMYDSVLGKEILEVIENNENNYLEKTPELNSAAKEVSRLNEKIIDSRNVLKILVTMPIINKYIDENEPDRKPLSEFAKEQIELIKKMEEVIKKYKK